jgi:hypothetical protein
MGMHSIVNEIVPFKRESPIAVITIPTLVMPSTLNQGFLN